MTVNKKRNSVAMT